MSSDEATNCPKCGAEIPQGAAGVLCPKCLLMGAEEAGTRDVTGSGLPPSAGGRNWAPPTIGELTGEIAGYEIEALIGRGGMGAVYRARQAGLDRKVAIKVLPKDRVLDHQWATRFERETRKQNQAD